MTFGLSVAPYLYPRVTAITLRSPSSSGESRSLLHRSPRLCLGIRSGVLLISFFDCLPIIPLHAPPPCGPCHVVSARIVVQLVAAPYLSLNRSTKRVPCRRSWKDSLSKKTMKQRGGFHVTFTFCDSRSLKTKLIRLQEEVNHLEGAETTGTVVTKCVIGI